MGDAQDTALLLDHKLRAVFGPDRVFLSSRSIPASAAFEPILLRQAAECSVFLAVIGPNWLAEGSDGKRRIDAPADWVRTEIEVAVAGGKPIIPILVEDRPKLVEDKLPGTIGSLAGKQYIRLHHRNADYGLLHIVNEIKRNLPPSAGISPPNAADSVLLTGLTATHRSSDVRLGPAEINGRHYGDSVIYRCTLFANETRGSISFNLGKRFRRLEVTAGVLDDAADAGQTGVFRVLVDGSVKQEVMAKQGQPRVLSVDVTDALNLQLLAYRPGTTESPILAGARMAGGHSNHLPELAWGNPTLHS